MVVKQFDRLLGFYLRRHFDKAKALGALCVAIPNQRDFLDRPSLAEQLAQLFLGNIVGQVADVQF
jgi:hypothetical protein